MMCVARPDKVDEALKCVCLQCASLGFGEKRDNLVRGVGKDLVAASGWSGMIPLQSIVSAVYVARANTPFHPFTTGAI